MSQKILLDKINIPGIKTYEVYRQNGGYASVEKALKTLTPDEVVTFYTMFNQRPIGKYMFEFCQTSPCCLNGVEDLMDYTCEKLGVPVGEPTADGLFEVRGVECLGACGYAPMMQLGDFYKEHLNKEKIDQLIADCKDDKIILHDK